MKVSESAVKKIYLVVPIISTSFLVLLVNISFVLGFTIPEDVLRCSVSKLALLARFYNFENTVVVVPSVFKASNISQSLSFNYFLG